MKKFKKYFTIVLFLLIAIPAAYTLWDMRQAKNMAADACNQAVKGKPLDEYLSVFSKKDYMIVINEKECILVPKRGMGRYQCIISHDGRIITGSKPGFLD